MQFYAPDAVGLLFDILHCVQSVDAVRSVFVEVDCA